MGKENEIMLFQQENSVEIYEAQERASIDIQVSTAKKYPRNLRRMNDNCIAIVCMNKETAESCRYSKPIGNNKTTSGASVHLARILAQQYGNIRIQQRIKDIGERNIVAEAIAFDLETNYAISVEARRCIIDKHGNRYSDAIIETNAMAVMAIAERNAILKIIPKSITDNVYNEAFKYSIGDLSDSSKLIIARDKWIKRFKNEYNATEDEVIFCLGLKTKEAIKAEDIATLSGFYNSLKEKEITVEELFKRAVDRKIESEIIQQNEPEQPKTPEQKSFQM